MSACKKNFSFYLLTTKKGFVSAKLFSFVFEDRYYTL